MTEKFQIDNWWVDQIELEEDKIKYFAPFLSGFVNGERTKRSILLWMNLEEGLAITEEKTFKLGEPNSNWHAQVLASGRDLEDYEIKGTLH